MVAEQRKVMDEQKQAAPTFNTYILAPIVANMSPLTTLQTYLAHMGQNVRNMSTTASSRLGPLKGGFTESNSGLPEDMEEHTRMLLDVLDKVTSVATGTWVDGPPPHVMPGELRDLNVIYDKKSHTLSIYKDVAGWTTYYIDDGVDVVLMIIQDKFWNDWEKYLIRRMKSYLDQATLPDEQEEARELLKYYYIFLRAYELRPFAESCGEEALSGGDHDGWERLGPTQQECMRIYHEVEVDFDPEQRKNLRTRVREMICVNATANIDFLHRCICHLFHYDCAFASKVLTLHTSAIADGNTLL